ncbi:hypothetical protein FRC00_001973 [Tulasnella sp. 408]|nr:hypothetical protein FRC00_001973 [Tulasnella sp. 408]
MGETSLELVSVSARCWFARTLIVDAMVGSATPAPPTESCKTKTGKLISMSTNPAVQDIGNYTSDEYLWTDPSAKACIQRGMLDADPKVAFKTIHALCFPSEFVVVDEEGTCGYVVGVPWLDATEQLHPGHPVLENDLLLRDLHTPSVLFIQQPCLENDFLGRIKRLDVQLDPLSDAEVKALYGETCTPTSRTAPAWSLSDGKMMGDMDYTQFDDDYDALNAPSSSTTSTLKLRRPRTLSDVGINLDILESMYQALSPKPMVPGLAVTGVNRPDASARKNNSKESYPHVLSPSSAGMGQVQEEEGVVPTATVPPPLAPETKCHPDAILEMPAKLLM